MLTYSYQSVDAPVDKVLLANLDGEAVATPFCFDFTEVLDNVEALIVRWHFVDALDHLLVGVPQQADERSGPWIVVSLHSFNLDASIQPSDRVNSFASIHLTTPNSVAHFMRFTSDGEFKIPA